MVQIGTMVLKQLSNCINIKYFKVFQNWVLHVTMLKKKFFFWGGGRGLTEHEYMDQDTE